MKKDANSVEILKKFRESVCDKENNPCPYWNKGCSFQKACHKLSQFQFRENKRIKEEKNASINPKTTKKGGKYDHIDKRLENIEYQVNDMLAKKRVDRNYLIPIYGIMQIQSDLKEVRTLISKISE